MSLAPIVLAWTGCLKESIWTSQFPPGTFATEQLADMLTKGAFATIQWTCLMRLFDLRPPTTLSVNGRSLRQSSCAAVFDFEEHHSSTDATGDKQEVALTPRSEKGHVVNTRFTTLAEGNLKLREKGICARTPTPRNCSDAGGISVLTAKDLRDGFEILRGQIHVEREHFLMTKTSTGQIEQTAYTAREMYKVRRLRGRAVDQTRQNELEDWTCSLCASVRS